MPYFQKFNLATTVFGLLHEQKNCSQFLIM